MNDYEIETYFSDFLNNETLKEYKVYINKIVENKGVKVVFKEAYIDDTKIYINLRFYNFNNTEINLCNAKIYVNDKKIKVYGGSGGSYYRYNDDFVGALLDYDIERENLDYIGDSLDIRFNIYALGYLDEEDDQHYIEGEWNCRFNFNIRRVLNSIKYIDVNKEINMYGKNIKIYSAKVTPLGIGLKHEYIVKYDRDENIGILDENQNVITMNSGQSSDDDGEENEFILETRNLSSITVVPYVYNRETMEDEVDIENSIVIDLD